MKCYCESRFTWFTMSRNLYKRTVYTIKDYYRIKRDFCEHLQIDYSLECDINWKFREQYEIFNSRHHSILVAIDNALLMIPSVYREEVFYSVIHGGFVSTLFEGFSLTRAKAEFVYHVAKNLGDVL